MVQIIDKTGPKAVGRPKLINRKKDQVKAGIHYGSLSKTNTSSVRRNRHGIPMAAPPITKTLKPRMRMPDTDGQHHLEEEALQFQVEVLMLKGVRVIDHVSATMGISWVRAKKIMQKVNYRWTVEANPQRLQQIKGESKARLNLLTNEIWALYSNTNSENFKGNCLTQLIAIHDRQMTLDGMTEKALEELRLEDHSGEESVENKILEHTKVVNLAAHLRAYLEKNMNIDEDAVDGEYADISNTA